MDLEEKARCGIAKQSERENTCNAGETESTFWAKQNAGDRE